MTSELYLIDPGIDHLLGESWTVFLRTYMLYPDHGMVDHGRSVFNKCEGSLRGSTLDTGDRPAHYLVAVVIGTVARVDSPSLRVSRVLVEAKRT